jgi:hypothetical protein
MSDAKPKYANFPEREPKVVIGANISAVALKALTKLSIGTYEMSFLQIEKGKQTLEAVRTALNHLAKAQPGWLLHAETHREYVGIACARRDGAEVKLWVTTPFELTQSNHLVWARVSETGETPKVGVAFRLNNTFTPDDVANLIKTAQKNAVTLGEGEAFVLKGNPPPRFVKKAPAADAAAPAVEAAAGDAATAEAAGGDAQA